MMQTPVLLGHAPCALTGSQGLGQCPQQPGCTDVQATGHMQYLGCHRDPFQPDTPREQHPIAPQPSFSPGLGLAEQPVNSSTPRSTSHALPVPLPLPLPVGGPVRWHSSLKPPASVTARHLLGPAASQAARDSTATDTVTPQWSHLRTGKRTRRTKLVRGQLQSLQSIWRRHVGLHLPLMGHQAADAARGYTLKAEPDSQEQAGALLTAPTQRAEPPVHRLAVQPQHDMQADKSRASADEEPQLLLDDPLLLLATAAETSLVQPPKRQQAKRPTSTLLAPAKRRRQSNSGPEDSATQSRQPQKPWHADIPSSARTATVSQQLAAKAAKAVLPAASTPPVSGRLNCAALPPVSQQLHHAPLKGSITTGTAQTNCSTPFNSFPSVRHASLPVQPGVVDARSLVKDPMHQSSSTTGSSSLLPAASLAKSLLSGTVRAAAIIHTAPASVPAGAAPVQVSKQDARGNKSVTSAGPAGLSIDAHSMHAWGQPDLHSGMGVAGRQVSGVWLSGTSRGVVSACLRTVKPAAAPAPAAVDVAGGQQEVRVGSAGMDEATPSSSCATHPAQETLDSSWATSEEEEAGGVASRVDALAPATTCDNNSAHCLVTERRQADSAVVTSNCLSLVKSSIRPPVSQVLLAQSRVRP